MNAFKLGLTFNDVLLEPKKTPLASRSEANLKTRFTKNLNLNIPLVSSNMATVTEHKMAISMAREGGIGIIHQFMTIEEQVNEVIKVKKSTCYIVTHPITINFDKSILDARILMTQNNITSLLVTDNMALVGILTRRDHLFVKDDTTLVKDIMTTKLIVADYGISLDEAKEILYKNRIEKLPLLEDDKIKGLITIQDINKLEYWSNACRDNKGRLCVGAAVGVKDTIERAYKLVSAGTDVIVLDVAHAHSDYVINKLKKLKVTFPHIDVMVGNIATGEAALDLILAGADGLKVGIGPSSVCTTRVVSGAGIPQLTAIMNVVAVAKLHDIPVCADGGMKYSGDIVKALAAGASSIYSGYFFAGTDESSGKMVIRNGKRYKIYKGSASYDSCHERREKEDNKIIKERIDTFVEGVATLVDYKGPVYNVIQNLIKGIQSGFSYCGSMNIVEMQEHATFIQITNNSWEESLATSNIISE